ncbi:MAG: GGDEF domain-containing protein [Oscillospiraceae bacterium]|nr:GGDEF domain-containing protein [Oscillospiraceae bacterium]
MSEETNRMKKRKKYLKLRKNHAWVSIPVFLITSAWCAMVFLGLAGLVLQLSLETRLDSAADYAASLAGMYETGGGEMLEMFDAQHLTYRLEQEDGKVLRQNGVISIGSQKGYYERVSENLVTPVSLGRTRISLYSDQSSPFLRQFSADTVCFDYSAICNIFFHEIASAVRTNPQMLPAEEVPEAEDDTGDVVESPEELVLRMPLWIAADANGGTERLLLRSEMTFRLSDLIMLVFLLGSLLVVFLVIIGFMLFDTISSFADQARISRIYFTDFTTKGRSRMWYLFRGEQVLRSRYAGKNRLAAVNLRFVRYQGFCVCHSLAEGERLLAEIHRRLDQQMHKREVCAHMTDGDFAMLLHYDTEEALAERLQNMIGMLQQIETEHSLAFHAGVAPVSGTGIRKSRKKADIELEFTHAGNACATLDGSDESGVAFFDQKLVDEQKWVDTVTEYQRRALENEEFLVYYQPKYDPQTSQLRGAEALIRWQSPEFGFVPPGRFIPIFEKNGFITEIDHYMIQHVAEDQRRWLDAGFSCVPVSVNVSRAHFIENNLAEQICDMVDAAGTPHRFIEIELTESAFFDDKKAMIRTITKLKEYGFAVSMDDFGSGYSSLNSLKDMPLDVLKLDAEFFRGEAADTNRGEIVVSEAIRLAKSLHMRTVAEGVEVKEQVDFLASQGCDMIQGYYFAKPMPGNEYEQRMESNAQEQTGALQEAVAVQE